MSWNIDLVGHRAAVKAKINAEQHLPAGVKAAIAEIIDDVKPLSTPAVRVETYGHFGGGYSSIGKLQVSSIGLVLDAPVPAPVAPPVSNEHVAEGCEKFTAPAADTPPAPAPVTLNV